MNRNQVKLALVIYFLVTVLVYAFLYGSPLYGVGHVVFYLLAPLASFSASLYTLRIYGHKNERSRMYFYMTLGFGSWFFAELLYYVLPAFGISPFPSLADVLFLLAYPLLYLGLFAEIKANKVSLTGDKMLINFSIFILFATVIAFLSAFTVYSAQNTFLENALNTLYSLGDLLLIGVGILLVNLMRELSGGKLYYSWLNFFIGLVLSLIADVLFGQIFQSYVSESSYYDFIDLIWIGAYLFFAYSLISIGLNIREIKQEIINKLVKDKK